jgi:hypothetical protein
MGGNAPRTMTTIKTKTPKKRDFISFLPCTSTISLHLMPSTSLPILPLPIPKPRAELRKDTMASPAKDRVMPQRPTTLVMIPLWIPEFSRALELELDLGFVGESGEVDVAIVCKSGGTSLSTRGRECSRPPQDEM